MSTIESAALIATMLENDGTYPGDPQSFEIAAYRHAETGKQLYFVAHSGEYEVIEAKSSPFVVRYSYVPLWTRGGGLTEAGRFLIDKARRGGRV